ncbi:hypothetical protein [Pedobacter endophyticus]|uniref:Uncharacterized protein n=1 Tax=Pedobacter endophyticus TaxID=2789740 RepID=A0A7S9Q048_9SPHI|nr:hypothetical protein [Pedobacter endophyticus]QPH41283.1 hypothetical protein IZT61_08520 [Pedobacter endophyticus]
MKKYILMVAAVAMFMASCNSDSKSGALDSTSTDTAMTSTTPDTTMPDSTIVDSSMRDSGTTTTPTP